MTQNKDLVADARKLPGKKKPLLKGISTVWTQAASLLTRLVHTHNCS